MLLELLLWIVGGVFFGIVFSVFRGAAAFVIEGPANAPWDPEFPSSDELALSRLLTYLLLAVFWVLVFLFASLRFGRKTYYYSTFLRKQEKTKKDCASHVRKRRTSSLVFLFLVAFFALTTVGFGVFVGMVFESSSLNYPAFSFSFGSALVGLATSRIYAGSLRTGMGFFETLKSLTKVGLLKRTNVFVFVFTLASAYAFVAFHGAWLFPSIAKNPLWLNMGAFWPIGCWSIWFPTIVSSVEYYVTPQSTDALVSTDVFE